MEGGNIHAVVLLFLLLLASCCNYRNQMDPNWLSGDETMEPKQKNPLN